MLIDSHCHLNYLDNPEEAIERERRRCNHLFGISVDEAGLCCEIPSLPPC